MPLAYLSLTLYIDFLLYLFYHFFDNREAAIDN